MSEILPSAGSLDQAAHLADMVQSGLLPGFIVRKTFLIDIDINELVTVIQPECYPFDDFHTTKSTNFFRYPPHIDCGFDGLSINFYRSGPPVKVELATLKGSRPNPEELFFAGKPDDMRIRESSLGPPMALLCKEVGIDIEDVFSAEIDEGTMTVFWAGNDEINPVLHYFNRHLNNSDTAKPEWARLSSLREASDRRVRFSKDYRREKAEENIESFARLIQSSLVTL